MGIFKEKDENKKLWLLDRLQLEDSLAIEVAQRFNGEVVSGDSQQVYQRIDIGTAGIVQKSRQLFLII